MTHKNIHYNIFVLLQEESARYYVSSVDIFRNSLFSNKIGVMYF